MKLQASTTAGLLMITSYDETHIAVSGRRMHRSFLLTPQHLDESWNPATPLALQAGDIATLAGLDAAILLLGTGRKQRFPAPSLLRPLIEQQRGIEVMDTYAACRTYNLLAAEGRSVAAALIIEPGS